MPDLSQAALPAAMIAFTAIAGASAAPSGATVAVIAIDVGIIATCLANPVAYFVDAGRWGELATSYAEHNTALDTLAQTFAQYWEGDAAEAFQNHWTSAMQPILPAMQGLASAEQQLLTAAGFAEISLIVSMISGTGGLIVALNAMNVAAVPTAGASLFGHWPAVAAWGTFLLAGVAAMATFLQELISINNEITVKLAELEALLADEVLGISDKVEVPTSALPDVPGEIQRLEQINEQFAVKG